MNKKPLTFSDRVATAISACNTEGKGVSYRTIYETGVFLEAFQEALSRWHGPLEAEILGLLRAIPPLLEILIGRAQRALTNSREASRMLSAFENEVQNRSSEDLDKHQAAWEVRKKELAEIKKKKSRAFEKARKEVADLLDFLEQMAEFGNSRTTFKFDFQPQAANVFHSMLKDMYRSGKTNTYPLSDPQMATIIMRYLGSPGLKSPAKDKPEYLLFQQIVGESMKFWSYWSDCPEFYTHVLRALHRTDQLHVLRRALYFDKLIPAFLRYAEEADRELCRKDIKTGEYGEFDPKEPLALVEKHQDYLHVASYMLFEVLQLILFCYYRPYNPEWWKDAAHNQ